MSKYSDYFDDALETKYLSLTNQGNLELYDGMLRMIESDGEIIEEFKSADYLDYIGEQVEDWSYAKFTYYLKADGSDSVYRCGPLARLNIADKITTPEAGQELKEFKKLGDGRPVHRTIYYHYARLIELLYVAERSKQLLQDDEIVDTEVRVRADRGPGEGIGVVEAPRGVLIHHYLADETGKLKKANLVVATTNNNQAINLTLREAAKQFVNGDKLTEGALNKVEMAIRCYDPCLSCSTHMIGQMPLEIVLADRRGIELDKIRR
jgi:NAD-reducing hydrogenase large subunit